MFKGKTIKGFPELAYFNGLRESRQMFMEATFGKVVLPEGMKLVSHSMFAHAVGDTVILPSTITALDELVFWECKIKTIVIKSPQVIDASAYWCLLTPYPVEKVYVPDNLVESYKAEKWWSLHKDYIRPLSEYQP